jgi:hypothetical protein
MKRKALISPGYGAGWSSWATGDVAKDILFDEKLIAAIERNDGTFDEALDDLKARMNAKYGDDDGYFYTGGARDLVVREIDGPFRVEEYDGSEYVITRDDEGWM